MNYSLKLVDLIQIGQKYGYRAILRNGFWTVLLQFIFKIYFFYF